MFLTTVSSDLKSVETRAITSYGPSDGLSAANTTLVKLDENRFVLMWKRVPYDADKQMWQTLTGNQFCYVIVDGSGNKLSDVKTVTGVLSDCQPLVRDGRIVWYATGGDTQRDDHTIPVFYTLDPNTGQCTSTKLRYVVFHSQERRHDQPRPLRFEH